MHIVGNQLQPRNSKLEVLRERQRQTDRQAGRQAETDRQTERRKTGRKKKGKRKKVFIYSDFQNKNRNIQTKANKIIIQQNVMWILFFTHDL